MNDMALDANHTFARKHLQLNKEVLAVREATWALPGYGHKHWVRLANR